MEFQRQIERQNVAFQRASNGNTYLPCLNIPNIHICPRAQMARALCLLLGLPLAAPFAVPPPAAGNAARAGRGAGWHPVAPRQRPAMAGLCACNNHHLRCPRTRRACSLTLPSGQARDGGAPGARRSVGAGAGASTPRRTRKT